MDYRVDNQLGQELADWRERVESIAPTLRVHSAESIKLRTLATALVAALEEIEAFKQSGPSEVGGIDAHPLTQLEAFVECRAPASRPVGAQWCNRWSLA